MADNIRGGSADTGLPLIATDDVSGVQYQRVKLDVGGNGLAVPVVGALPVELPGTDVIAVNSSAATSPFTIELPAVASNRNYVSGFVVSGQGATAASWNAVQLIGVHANTLYFMISIPAGIDRSMDPLLVTFARPLPALAVNQAIQLVVPQFGAGNTLFSAALYGFYR